MKSNLTIHKLKFILVLAVMASNTIYAQKEKYMLDECYNFHHSGIWVGKYMWDMLVADDFVLCGGMNAGDQPGFTEIDNFQLNSQSDPPLAVWIVYFNGIDKSNQALAYIPNVAGNEMYRAEAKFMRAYCYFNLVRLFGGVPLITENCSTKLANLKRATVAEVYAQIEQDLTDAIPILPQKSSLAATEKYKATKGAAHAVYAQTCLYQQKWSKAATHLSSIINSGEYNLMANYADLWLMANEHNVESVFELEYYNNKGYDWGNANWTDPESNIHIQLFGPTNTEVIITDNSYNYGWGFGRVTKSLSDFFDAQGDKIRKKATILVLDSIGTKVTGAYQYTGYKNKKYSTRSVNTSGPTPELNYGQNIVDIRYAEILLMYAEVQARLGNNVEAINYVNRVRARAGLPNLSPALSNAALLDAIFMERTLELALEGKRFQDIVRWGKGNELLGAIGYNAHDSIWPIPAKVIGQYPAITQNPGYTSSMVISFSLLPQKNEYAPAPSLPWIKNMPKKVYPTTMKQYKYNFCMSDSFLNVQASYSYNSKKLMESYTESLNVGATGNLTELYRETYMYDNNDRLTKSVKMQYNSNKWDTVHANFYRYQGVNVVTDSSGTYSAGASGYFEVTRFTWNDQESYYQNTYDVWTKSTNVYVKSLPQSNVSNVFLTYNSNNQISNESVKTFDKNSSTWNNTGLTKRVYSNRLLTKQEVFLISTNDTTETSKTDYEYNTDNKIQLEKNYQLNSKVLELKDGEQYSYGSSSYKTTKTPMLYLSLVEDLHHNRECWFYDMDEQMAKSNQADIVSFSVPGQTGNAIINAVNHTIAITKPYGTSVSSLIATFTLSAGATAKVGTITQVTGTTINDFSNVVTYIITAEDGTTIQNWTVTVSLSTNVADVLSDEAVLVYPNPSTGLFQVKINVSKQTKIDVYNLEGCLVMNKTIDISGEQTLYVDLTGNSAGVYFLQFLNDNKIIQVKLFKK